MKASQRETLAVLGSALRSEAHLLERWPHLLGQQLHHHCARRGGSASHVAAMLERHLDGRSWIRKATYFGRPVPAGRWSLGRGRDIVAARLTRDGRHAVALSRSTCVVWSAGSGELVSELSFAGLGQASALAVAPDGHAIAIGHSNGYCSLWNLADGALLLQWQAHDDPIEAVALANDSRYVATFAGGPFTKALRIWRPPSDRAVRERLIEDTKIVESMSARLQQTGAGTIRDPGQAVRCVGLEFLPGESSVLWAQPGIAGVWDWSRDEIVWRTERVPRWWGGGVVSYDDGIVAACALDEAGAFVVADESGAVERSHASNDPPPQPGSVQRLVFSADAAVYLAASARGESRIGWRASDGWREHAVDLGGASHIDITADGRLAIAAVEDRCALFDVSELTARAGDLGLDGDVSGAAFTADGAACTLGGYSDVVHVQIGTAELLWRANCAEGALTGLARAANAPVAAVSSRNGALLIVRDVTPGASKTMAADDQELTCVAISEDSQIVAAGCASGAVLVWDTAMDNTYRRIQVFDDPITAIAWLAGTTLAVAAEAQDVRTVNVRRPQRHTSLRAHEAWVTCLAGCAGRGLLLSGGMDGRICLWEPGRATEPRAVWRDRIEPAAIAWLPEAGLMASVDARGMFRLRSASGAEMGLCPLDGPAVALQCLDGNRAGYANASGEVTVLDFHGIPAKE